MFEAAEVGASLDKQSYKAEEKRLRTQLLEIQKKLAASKIAINILIGGVEGAGKSEVVNLLLSWLDARGIEVNTFGDPSDEERERPRFWRYWRLLPMKGRMGIFFGSWYTDPVVDRVFKRIGQAEFDREMTRIADFERMLHREGDVLVKFWLHLSKKAQKKRLTQLARDPRTRWRVTPIEWRFFKRYDRFRRISEQALLRTSRGSGIWRVVEGTDWRWRDIEVAKQLLAAMKEGLEEAAKRPPNPKPKPPVPPKVNVLSTLDLSKSLTDKAYDRELLKYQGRLNLLTRKLRDKNRSMILVFEGPDAAGKGGAIRRLTEAMDSRSYVVNSVAAPTDEEKARPYLWRFWRKLPRLGHVAIYDRSWYGRVLVERLEGFAAPEEWERAFGEINAFEAELAEFGTILVKFWIQISPEEELARFKDREKTPYKQYKLTEEDWRNREKWDGYQAAACEMVERCGTARAPWVLVEGNDKKWARIKILKETCRRLEKALK